MAAFDKGEGVETAPPIALYVHWPFCLSKCPYCDFNSHVRDRVDQALWKDALLRELKATADRIGPRRLTSIFFGGGTPSLAAPTTIAAVIEAALCLWNPKGEIEITLEANPTSVEIAGLKDLHAAGVNRVSMGVQSLREESLTFLGRRHTSREALQAVEAAGRIFPQHSFDLIYALPNQTPNAWAQELQEALHYSNGHLSVYQLTIEPGTAFHTAHRLGQFTLPDEDTAEALYDLTQETLATADMPAYEISNHANSGRESQHNLTYWRAADYIGIGPGAHGRITIDGVRRSETRFRLPEKWLKSVQKSQEGLEEAAVLNAEENAREALLMGLRLTEGVDLTTRQEALSTIVSQHKLDILVKEGLLEINGLHWRATKKGRKALNAVLSFLID